MAVNVYFSKNGEILNAYKNILASIYAAKQRENQKTFLLCGSEPRVGTTTVAINLAICIAEAGWNTCLVDGNMCKGENAKRLNDGIRFGLSDYLTDGYTYIIHPTNIEKLSYIPSISPRENTVNLLCSDAMDTLFATLRERYDFILLDMPPLSASNDAGMIAAKTDAVIFITAIRARLELYRESIALLQGKGANILGVIVNKADRREHKKSKQHINYFTERQYLKHRRTASRPASQTIETQKCDKP